MVYQEQVMQIAQVIGGYTLGGADLLRRAMGKKKPEEMAQQRDIFVAGAEKNGLSQGKATQLFDLMEKFAGYGFNKSHAAAYALLAYQTAYMKAHHAAAFMAANLSAVMDDTDKVRQFHEDARGQRPRRPAARHQRLRVPLRAGRPQDRPLRPGRGARHRRVGHRRDHRGAQGRAVQGPVRLLPPRRQAHGQPPRGRGAGARRRLRLARRRTARALLASRRPRASRRAEQAERSASQNSLFGEAEAPRGGAHAYVDAAPWDLKQKLLEEKTALGFYLSGHLFSVYERELVGLPAHAARQARRRGDQVWHRRHRGRGAHPDDAARPHDGGDARRRHRAGRDLGVQRAVREAPRQAEGRRAADRRRARCRTTSSPAACASRAEELLDLEALRATLRRRGCKIAMNGAGRREAPAADARALPRQRQRRLPGDRVLRNARRRCEVALGEAWRVRPDAQLIGELRRLARAGERAGRLRG